MSNISLEEESNRMLIWIHVSSHKKLIEWARTALK